MYWPIGNKLLLTFLAPDIFTYLQPSMGQCKFHALLNPFAKITRLTAPVGSLCDLDQSRGFDLKLLTHLWHCKGTKITAISISVHTLYCSCMISISSTRFCVTSTTRHTNTHRSS